MLEQLLGRKLQYSDKHCKFLTEFQQDSSKSPTEEITGGSKFPKNWFTAPRFAFLMTIFWQKEDILTIFRQPKTLLISGHSPPIELAKLYMRAGHKGAVRSICVLDSENSFITASKDRTVRLWSLRNCFDGSARSVSYVLQFSF